MTTLYLLGFVAVKRLGFSEGPTAAKIVFPACKAGASRSLRDKLPNLPRRGGVELIALCRIIMQKSSRLDKCVKPGNSDRPDK